MGVHKETILVLEEIHAFLRDKATRKGVLEMDQVALAAEFGLPHDRFHRMVQRLCKDGRLKQIGKGNHGSKTVIVQ